MYGGWNVTITGVDDGVSLFDMAARRAAYPFLEWGILRSNLREGFPRFPSRSWVSAVEVFAPANMNLAVHLCGEMSVHRTRGLGTPHIHGVFDRVQLNGFGWSEEAVGLARPERIHQELILQCNSEEMLPTVHAKAVALAHLGQRVSVLFDPSCGKGKPVDKWPRVRHLDRRVLVGFAGGIGPDNILDVLRKIEEINAPDPGYPDDGWQPTWVDMESGVRTEGRLDWKKVDAVLSKVAATWAEEDSDAV
jgi:hypothetical protein